MAKVRVWQKEGRYVEEEILTMTTDLLGRIIGYREFPDSFVDQDRTTRWLYLPLEEGSYYKFSVNSREKAEHIAHLFIVDPTFSVIREFLQANNFKN